jgi:hypothetical protein
MKLRLVSHRLPLLVLFLALVPIALASSTWYVDGVNGSNKNDCKSPQTACKTIRHAISLASSGDSIMIAAAIYKENLTINFSLKLIGAGASTTIVDGRGINSVIYAPPSSAHIALSNLTIRNGYSRGGAGIANNEATITISNSNISGNVADDTSNNSPDGGGIYNGGTMTINHTTVTRNITINGYDGWGGGIYNGGTLTIDNSTITENSGNNSYTYGGAISNYGTLVINRSTLDRNSAPDRCGGGIDNEEGTLTINNSTISLNVASEDGAGGGICNNSSATVSINNSTLSGNSAAYGAGISSVGTATFQNSIVGNSPKGEANCAGTMTSNGYNLSSDDTCKFHNTGDLNSTNPRLGRLQNNGGPTQTHALLDGSPAIDAGNPTGCTDGQGHLLKTDQRGRPRPDHDDTGGCDMGAFERQRD